MASMGNISLAFPAWVPIIGLLLVLLMRRGK